MQNKLGYRFICLLETENEEFDRYIIAPVSICRYNAFIRNQWSIRRLYTDSELGGVFSVTFCKSEIKINYLRKSEIELMNLPDENEMLEYSNAYTTNEILYKSVETNVPILQKSFEKDGGHRQYIFANELAKESAKFQNIFDGICKDEINNSKIKLSEDQIREKMNNCRVPIFGTYVSSFGIQVEGIQYPELIEEETDFSRYLKIYFELLDVNSETNMDFMNYHKEALCALTKYYKTLLALGFSVNLKAATPSKWFKNTYLRKEEILFRYKFLNQTINKNIEQLEFAGKWSRIDYRKKKFEFKCDNNEIIEGKLDDDFDTTIFDFNDHITILVEKTIEVNKSGAKLEKYILLSII